MADISSITLPNNGGTYNFKDKRAYRLGEDVRHKNSSISQDPQYVQLITNKMTSEELQTIRAIAGVGDYFYALHLNPDYTVTSNYNGAHGTKGNFNISTLFNPSGSSTVLLDVDSIAQTPFVLEITKKSGNITATDVVNLELFSHTLGQSSSRLTDYKVELYTTGSTASSGTYSWQTVYQRSNVSDSPSGLIICLNPTSYAYLYFSGVRFTISGATPGSTSSSAWNYNCLDLSLFRLIDQRPAFTAARAIGALDIAGGSVYGAVSFAHGITGNLTGNASTATKATQDESGNNIKASYASSFSISDHTITLKNKNGASLGTVTVPDTNTHRPIQVNSTQVLGDNTTALNLAAGSNMSITSDENGNVTFAASGSAMPFMIVRQPVPVGISTDNTVVTFSIVLGGGTGSYTYQWQLMSGGTDWIDLGGSQESSIDILGHLVTDTIHRCVVSDGVTTLYSNPVYYYGINSGVTGVKQSVNDGNYGVCSTAAGTAAKTVSIPGLIVQPGVTIHVKFTNTNSASNPTLAVNSTPAKSIVLYGTTAIGTTAETTGWNAGAVVALTYDGTYWIRDQGYNTNTTYSNATTSSAGLMSAADKTAVNALKNLSTLEYEIVS